MVNSNAGDAPGTLKLEVDLVEQLAIVDSLPKEAKHLVLQSPIHIDARQIRDVILWYGLSEGIRLTEQVYDQEFPGWRGRAGK